MWGIRRRGRKHSTPSGAKANWGKPPSKAAIRQALDPKNILQEKPLQDAFKNFMNQIDEQFHTGKPIRRNGGRHASVGSASARARASSRS
jgi:hypothetical protein